MAILEDIVGVVVIIVVVLAASILLVTEFSEKMLSKGRYNIQEKLEARFSDSFNALLTITEQNTNRIFGDLLGSSVYYRNKNIKVRDKTVDVEKEFKKLIDKSFNDYYFEVTPAVSSIEMIFIIGGIDSLNDEIVKLAKNKDNIIKELKEKFKSARMKVYILSNYTFELCNNFDSDCYYLDYKDIYYNDSASLENLKKRNYNLSKPKNIGYSPEVWQSDWETALSYMIISTENQDLSDFKIFFPILDKLPTATKYFYPCPEEYSKKILPRDRQIIKEFNFIVNPIFSVNADPIIYCDDKVSEQLKGIINFGKVFFNKDNFIENIIPIIIQNIEDSKIKLGKKYAGKSYVMERKLMMPNAKLATARLYVYE